MAEKTVCRSRYCMLARFSPGDPVYVDRADYVVSELPRELTRRPLVAVQTAQNDKRSFSGNFLSFHLSKVCGWGVYFHDFLLLPIASCCS